MTHAAALARVAERPRARSLAQQRPLLPAEPVAGDHQNPEYRIAEDLRSRARRRSTSPSGIFSRAALGDHVHRRAVVHRRRADDAASAATTLTIPGFLVDRGGALRGARERLDGARSAAASSRHPRTRTRPRRSTATRSRACARTARASRSSAARARSAPGSTRRSATVLQRWRELLTQWMRTTVVSQTSSAFVPVLPILLCAPKYVAGDDDARRGHAGVVGVRHRAGGVQLAGRQLSPTRRLDRLGAPARRRCWRRSTASSAPTARRRIGPHRARRDRGRRAPPARPVGHAGRRQRRGERGRRRHRARREGARRRRVGHRQEHARARDLRAVAVGRRARS